MRAAGARPTFQSIGLGRLDGLCTAARFSDRRRQQALDTLDDMLAPWGDWLVGNQPPVACDIGDDHFPIEHSLALSGEDVEIRVLMEAQTPSGRRLDSWTAGHALNARLVRRHRADLERFEKIAALFEPSTAARFGIWHAACFTERADPTFKVYVNPQARGKEHAPAVVAEALARLGFSREAVNMATAPRPRGVLKFFALDLEPGPGARVKVYYAHDGVDRRGIEAELSCVPGFSADALDGFWRTIAQHDGPFLGLPLTTYLSFTEGADLPTSGIVHFPVRDYADDDRIVYERVMALLEGRERELYARALAGFAKRALEDGVGMQTYVAQRVGRGGRRVTVYLSPEGYRVAPARARSRTGTHRRVDLESALKLLNFQGDFATDEGARREASQDVGGLVSKPARAVLRPRSIEDLQIAVRACRGQRVPLVARGQGRTPFGQSQIEDGVVVEMGGLNRIHSICDDKLTVDAGAVWQNVLRETAPRGVAPPVLTAFQGLSVGGTLSVGGFSGLSYRRGAQVDHVLELQVVTGEGELVTCSRNANPELFDMVRAGLGQCAIIARATIALVPTPAWVRHVTRRYLSLSPFLSDLRELVRRAELDGISGTFQLEPQGLKLELNAVSFMPRGAPPDMEHLLRDLSEPAEMQTRDLQRVAYHSEVDELVSRLRAGSAWDRLARPWFDVFLPDSAVDEYLSSVLSELTTEDVGAPELGALGQLHLFPLLGQHLHSPLLRVPAGSLVHLFDILTCSRTPADEQWAQRMQARNRRLFERARELGGTKYNIAAIPFTADDWKAQLGERYEDLRRLKQRFDPDRILNPGLGIFS